MNLTIVRFHGLKERGIVESWAQLRRLQELHDFPLGRLIGPKTRTWTLEEIAEWYSTRPTESSAPLKGAAKERRARRLATQSEQSGLDQVA
jgi:hypothetical protein